jgi:Ca-activated chloride channel homolog
MFKRRFLMTFVIISILILTLSGFSTPPANLAQGDPSAKITQVDTTQFPVVTVYISVVDSTGEPVAVSPSNLVIRENGVVMTPDDIGSTGDSDPLVTMLVMDISGSMNHADKINSAKRAALAYVDQSRPKDLIGLVSFETEIDYVQPLTSNHKAVETAINDLKVQGDTAMYDALARSIEYMEAVSGRKAIIVMTDGLDNRSKISPQEVLQMIGPEGLSISTIGLGIPDHSTSALSSLDEAALSALAEQAGGTYGYANDEESLRKLYELYGRALQSEYYITYTSPSTLRDGINRALSVSLDGNSNNAATTINETQGKYNPGGLIPEVANPATWGLFLALVVGLALLLLVPLLIRTIRFQLQSKKGIIGIGSKKKSRIKLK